jgi:hypothetical protein
MGLLPKSTVRNRKMSPLTSTQRFLPIAEIRNDAIILKNGGVRAVLKVEALNFNLKSETEQQGIIAGYGAFVNTLTFPLQIVIRSFKTNIDEYVFQMQGYADKQQNALLKEQTQGYIDFMQHLVEVADIMQKKFYVIVPVDHSERKKTYTEKFFDWIHPDDTSAKASQRNKEFGGLSKQLNERVDLVAAGLANVGLHTDRLDTRGLMEMLYQVYNPKTSQTEKMPADTDALETQKMVI